MNKNISSPVRLYWLHGHFLLGGAAVHWDYFSIKNKCQSWKNHVLRKGPLFTRCQFNLWIIPVLPLLLLNLTFLPRNVNYLIPLYRTRSPNETPSQKTLLLAFFMNYVPPM